MTDYIDVLGEKIMADTAKERSEAKNVSDAAWEKFTNEVNVSSLEDSYFDEIQAMFAKHYQETKEQAYSRVREIVAALKTSADNSYWRSQELAVTQVAKDELTRCREFLSYPVENFAQNMLTLKKARLDLQDMLKKLRQLAEEDRKQYFAKKDELTPEEE